MLQLTAEEELLFVIKSAWKALQHYGTRKALACEDICVMVDILKPVMPRLQPTLPVELKRALFEVAEGDVRPLSLETRVDGADLGMRRGRERGVKV